MGVKGRARPAKQSPQTDPTYFPSAAAFGTWLRQYHASHEQVLVGFHKKHTGRPSLTWPESVDEALCYGWIDGVRRSLDADGFSVRFSPRKPRKPRSIWSRVNIRHAKRLIAEGRMRRAGLAAFEARKAGRTEVYSFEQRPAELPPALKRRFRLNGTAWQYFRKEAPWYRRTSTFWILSAKREETRLKRLETLIACSAEGTRIPPLRRKKSGT
jgi:uncharacterized protein YdeI (YjbR/CyaY-like superfamily)